jgi:hypothetical protein
MCGTFRAEPAAPRTVFRDRANGEVCRPTPAAFATAEVSVAAQAMTNVLVAFPEAYEAVVAEMRRLRTPGDQSP